MEASARVAGFSCSELWLPFCICLLIFIAFAISTLSQTGIFHLITLGFVQTDLPFGPRTRNAWAQLRRPMHPDLRMERRTNQAYQEALMGVLDELQNRLLSRRRLEQSERPWLSWPAVSRLLGGRGRADPRLRALVKELCRAQGFADADRTAKSRTLIRLLGSKRAKRDRLLRLLTLAVDVLVDADRQPSESDTWAAFRESLTSPSNAAHRRRGQARHHLPEAVVPLHSLPSGRFRIPLEGLQDSFHIKQGLRTWGFFDNDICDSQDKIKSAERWMKFLNNHDIFAKSKNPAQKPAAEDRVHVAVLDTGFEVNGELMGMLKSSDQICEETSKCFMSSGAKAKEAWQSDLSEGQHGTAIARLVNHVARYATVHIGRIAETKKQPDPNDKDEGYWNKIAEATHRAIIHATNEWKVDIIVMSFGLSFRKKAIHDALEIISQTKTPPLLFVSTGNHGVHGQVQWPASRGDVFGIGATDGDGVWSAFNSAADEGSEPIFYALGEGISVKVGKDDVQKHVTGTSYATPIAAALAANLLGFVRSYAKQEPEYEELYNDLRRREGMRAVLRDVMTKKNVHGDKSLIPWDFWARARQDPKRALDDLVRLMKRT